MTAGTYDQYQHQSAFAIAASDVHHQARDLLLADSPVSLHFQQVHSQAGDRKREHDPKLLLEGKHNRHS
eukprot:SAG11_NODE_18075_length_500_cov_1.663342_2_plen_68_part_01